MRYLALIALFLMYCVSYGELFFHCKYVLTAEEEAQVKREKRHLCHWCFDPSLTSFRMICNRMSALMSRVNQRARLDELERLVTQLRQQNTQLTTQLQAVMQHSVMLEAQSTSLFNENARLQRMLQGTLQAGMPASSMPSMPSMQGK